MSAHQVLILVPTDPTAPMNRPPGRDWLSTGTTQLVLGNSSPKRAEPEMLRISCLWWDAVLWQEPCSCSLLHFPPSNGEKNPLL